MAFKFKNGSGSVKQLRLCARCDRDAMVEANKGVVRVVLKIHDSDGEAKSRMLEIKFSGHLSAELALELAAKLKKDKKVMLWARIDNGEIRPRRIEIDDGVLYRI